MELQIVQTPCQVTLRSPSLILVNGRWASCQSTTARTCVWKPKHTQWRPVSAGRRVPISSEEDSGKFQNGLPGFEGDQAGFLDSFPSEEGIFEETFPSMRKVNTKVGGSSSLIPDEWKPLQKELSKTKKEKKREIIGMLVERAKKIQVQKRLSIDAGDEEDRHQFFPGVPSSAVEESTAGSSIRTRLQDKTKESVDEEEDEMWEEITSDSEMDETDFLKMDEKAHAPTFDAVPFNLQRATPRNPRLSLSNTPFEDVATVSQDAEELGREESECRPGDNDDETKELSGSKLLSAEEKAMLRSPELHLARISSGKWSPLHTLAASGQINLMTQLLRHQVDLNAVDMDGMTALHRAVLNGRESMVKHLLKIGADALARDKAGATVLHYAVQAANSNLIKLLIRHHIPVDASDDEGWTPLHVAVQSGRTDIVKLLLSRGADITIPNKDGNTPLDVALSYGKGFGFYHVVKLLKKAPQGLLQFALLGEK